MSTQIPPVAAELIDPGTVEVITNRLDSIVEEMGLTVVKTAHSPSFTEAKDFSVAIFNDQAQMIAMAQFIPLHQGGMQTAIEATLKEIPPEEIYPGDVIMMNDSYRGGLHPQDLTLFSPVYVGDEIVMYVGCVAHHSDMGGMTPSSYCPLATEIYQEAIRFPAVKLFERGVLRKDVLRLFLTNIRLPHEQEGDLFAQVGALRVGERRVLELIDRWGLPTIRAALANLFDRTEQLVRAEIERIPDGDYEFTDYLDHDGHSDRLYKFHVTLSVRGSNLRFDYTGSDEQAKGFINCPWSLARAATYSAVMFFLEPRIPRNMALQRCVEVYAPLGTIMNPRHPAPLSAATTEGGGTTFTTALGALGQARPERAIGCWPHLWFRNTYYTRENPLTGRPVIAHPMDGGGVGGGARMTRDGWNCSHVIGSAQLLPNIEVNEENYPMRYIRRELPVDGGGPGRRRGGIGVEAEFIIETDSEGNVISSRRTAPSFGVFGGKPGAPSIITIRRGDEEIVIPQKATGFQVKKGDRIVVRCPGGGGYGDPVEREVELVERDVRLGWISLEGARRDYGVAIDPVTGRANLEETAKLRAAQ